MEYVLLNKSHAKAMAALEQECFSDPWSENAFLSEAENPLALWLVAMDGDQLAGYVGSQSVLGWADMMNVAVAPCYRRQGIGRELTQRLISLLQEEKVSCLTLEVRVSNKPAIKLYEQMGFVEVGRRKNYYHNPKEDALILRREWQI